jgi:hypothetical protein
MLFRKVLGGGFEHTEGDGAVVALDKNVVFRDEAFALGRAGGAVEGDVFLDKDVVEVDGEEAGLFEKGADDVELTPERSSNMNGWFGDRLTLVAHEALGAGLVKRTWQMTQEANEERLFFRVSLEKR